MSELIPNAKATIGMAALLEKGRWHANRYLILRRFSQFSILSLFLLGPVAGIWIVKGNLSSSLTMGVLPLTDPFSLVQVLMTRHWPELAAIWGALWVVLFYGVIGGRIFCSWVCPVNMVTDSASWLRRKFGIRTGRAPANLRNWLLLGVLAGSAITGVTIWEWVNPVNLTQRAIIFGGYAALGSVLAVFMYDLFIAPRGWCGHLCPVGAMYSLIGHQSFLRISAQHSSRCNDCAECYAVCPEPHVIPMALKGKEGASPLIVNSDCTLCARCVDVCAPEVFLYSHRFNHKRD